MPLITNPEDLIRLYLSNSGQPEGTPYQRAQAEYAQRTTLPKMDFAMKGFPQPQGGGPAKPIPPPELTPFNPLNIASTAPHEDMFKFSTEVKSPQDEAIRKAKEALDKAGGAPTTPTEPTTTEPTAPTPAPHPFEGQYTVDPNAKTGFDAALKATFIHEGGYNPKDANGVPVNMGINAAYHPNVDIKNLTKEQAAAIYKRDYWDAIDGDKLPTHLQAVAFDTAVISGPAQAKKLLEASGGDLDKFLALRAEFEEGLVKANPEKYGQYAKTWATRRASYAPPKAPPLANNTPEPPAEPGTKVGEHRNGWFWNGASWDKAYARGGHIKDLLALSRSYR